MGHPQPIVSSSGKPVIAGAASGDAEHLLGHLPPTHALSPRRAFAALRFPTRLLVDASPVDPWELDTRRLPATLQRLRRRTRAFVQRELEPLALQIDAMPHWPAGQQPEELNELLRRAGRAGLLTDTLPWPLGSGPPMRYRHSLAMQQSIKVEELARGCGGLMLLLSAHVLGLAPLLQSGDPRLLRRFVLPAFRACRRGDPHLFAYAITEPAAGSDVEDGHGAACYRPGVVARRTEGGWLLRGRKCFISGGDVAKSIAVFAALDGEDMASWTCFLVHNDSPGFRVARTELKMGMRASGAAELELEDVFVPSDRVVGGLRQGWALNRATLNMSRLPVGAMAVGFAQAAADIAVDFARSQRLGDRRLIDYQEVQTAIADMLAECAAIRAFIWQSARSWAPRQMTGAACKFHCTDAAVRVAYQAMDLLGNHAVLPGMRAEKVFRDARLTQIFEGTNQINRLALIEDMQDLFLNV
ncbi:acyl-CoA dehydrogenase family protein [Algiphilus aromaticivorans]|uniref:acyl-CoA dehydrogenase family protein n=1 Tax=Algiphilus aromaticivorans TaxID=382454 RepID=UPI000A04A484|nr:acyl-CoA dehydrogenase family protein [Algiphilus aromaticivorans]